MKLWIISMECAGIVEAGGVKNVTLALCQEFSSLNNDVTLFIPVFKSTSKKYIKHEKVLYKDIEIKHCGKSEFVTFSKGTFFENPEKAFDVVFINHPSFAQKEAVYTYTDNEHQQNPEFIKGHGHRDTLFMDSLFSKAVNEYSKLIEPQALPQIIHCQDASTALVPVFTAKNKLFSSTKTIVTIHNAGPAYHHNFENLQQAVYYTDLPEYELYCGLNNSKIEPFLLAAGYGANISTVSPEYALELKSLEFEEQTEGLSKIFNQRDIEIKGITNGIDFSRYNPANKKISLLPYEFNPEKLELEGKKLCREYLIKKINSSAQIDGIIKYGSINKDTDLCFVYHGRITEQKGIKVLLEAIPVILNNFPKVSFIIAGQGQLSLENQIIDLTGIHKGKVAFLNGYNKKFVRLTNAAGDFIILPSFFEPCGLEDFISQIYGTVPVAHKTGGLNKILNMKTGFLYENNTSSDLTAKLSQVITLKYYCPKTINAMIKNGAVYVHKNYDWNKVIKSQYLKYFKDILKNI